MKGLNGWLAPDGKFYCCKYGEHSEIARIILQKLGDLKHRKFIKNNKQRVPDSMILREEWYIYMGSKGENHSNSSYIHITKGLITKKQKKWIRDHIDQLDETQQRILKEKKIIC